MIQENELRFGNYVKDEYFGIGKVIRIARNSVSVKLEHSTLKRDSNVGVKGLDIEPIKLSNDILLKAGFEKCSCGGFKNAGLHLSLDDKGKLSYKQTKLKTLHQLQNLFFALNGTELEVAW